MEVAFISCILTYKRKKVPSILSLVQNVPNTILLISGRTKCHEGTAMQKSKDVEGCCKTIYDKQQLFCPRFFLIL